MTDKDRAGAEDTRVHPQRCDATATSGDARLGAQRLAATVLGAVSIALIAFAALSLVRDGDFSGLLQTTAIERGSARADSATSSGAKGNADDADARQRSAEGDGSGNEADKQPAQFDGSSQGGSATSAGGAASGGAASGSGNASGGASSSQQRDGANADGNASDGDPSASKPATVTVRVAIDASAAGGGTLASTTLTFSKGATVYDALCGCGVSVNARDSQFGIYVASIGGYAEKEHGDMSGWTYYVNGVFANKACSAWTLNDGDSISWAYVTG